ncbi:MAG: hypothetical protein PVS3B3_18120 [Ktedonobacteraceae bacterium]
MPATASVHTGWLIGLAITSIFAIVYPFVLVIISRLRLGVHWRYFWYGTLVFLAFQLLTRVPAVFALNSAFASQLKASALFRFIHYDRVSRKVFGGINNAFTQETIHRS